MKTADTREPEPPEPIRRLNRLLWFDISPLRPDEYGRQTACHWIEAEQVQKAWRMGVEDARSEVAP